MNIIKLIWGLFNGQKLNTGTIMILAVILLKQLGMDETTANNTATSIMLGTGGVIALVGYIHQWIKGKKKS